MKCPACSNGDTKVVDSRTTDSAKAIRRRRSCEYCGHRFTTLEKLIVTDLVVRKKDWTKELYDKDKLTKALAIAFWKKNFSLETIDEIVTWLEAKRSWPQKEIDSTQIWADVLSVLKSMDEVAYVRFASVFQEFDWVEDFGAFIQWTTRSDD